MILLVPAFSPSFFVRNSGADTVFVALGPLSAGMYVRRFYVTMDTLATATVSVAATLGRSSTADAATFQAGTSLLTRSNGTVLGKPAWSMVATGARIVEVEAFIGTRVEGGSGWVIVRCATVTAGASFAGGLEVERLVDVGVTAAGEVLRAAVR